MFFGKDLRIDQDKLKVQLEKSSITVDNILAGFPLPQHRNLLHSVLLGESEIPASMVFAYILATIGCRAQDLLYDDIVNEILLEYISDNDS